MSLPPRLAGWVTVTLAIALVATGIWLQFYSLPTAALAWDDIDALQSQVVWSIRMRRIHTALVFGLVIAAGVWLGLLLADRLMGRILLAVGVLTSVGVGVLSGVMVPWQQVGLRAVTTGTNMMGFEPISENEVSIVLVDGTAVSASTVRFWVIVHLAAGLAAVLLAVLAALASRRTRVEAEQSVPANPLA